VTNTRRYRGGDESCAVTLRNSNDKYITADENCALVDIGCEVDKYITADENCALVDIGCKVDIQPSVDKVELRQDIGFYRNIEPVDDVQLAGPGTGQTHARQWAEPQRRGSKTVRGHMVVSQLMRSKSYAVESFCLKEAFLVTTESSLIHSQAL